MTASPIGILRSTFLDDPTPTPSMPAFYKHIHSTLNPNFFYLSASPYNLYPFLRPFLHANYPRGTVILRDNSWQTISGMLASLTQGVGAYKASRIDKIHDWLPRRKIICVGDSTQSDPEAYGEIYRKYPGWVKAIFIRRVMEASEMQGSEKNKPERFEKAFEGVPKNVWRVFEEDQVEQLWSIVDGLKGI